MLPALSLYEVTLLRTIALFKTIVNFDLYTLNLFDEQIKRISDKLHHLLKGYTSLKKENEKLKNELHSIKSREKEKNDELQLLALRIDVLKASKGGLNEEEKKSFEKKITRYIKDIEKCIALLNE